MRPRSERLPTVPAVLRIGLSPLPLRPLALAVDRVARAVGRRHPDVFARLGEHTGKRFAIDPTDLPFLFVLTPRPDRPLVEVARSSEDVAADARIAGPVAALLGLVHGAYDGDALFFSRDLVVEGDIGAVVALRNALDNAELDLVSEMAAALGPLADPAERIGRLAAPILERLIGIALTRTHGAAP